MTPDELQAMETDSWFGALAEASRALLLQHSNVRKFADGAKVYRFDDPPNGLHGLISGEVRLVSYPVAGFELIGKIIRPGNWFGELSVLDGKGRPHDAVAVGPATTLTVSMTSLRRLMKTYPELWREIALLSCIHQRAGLRDTGRVRTEPAQIRLARFLSAAGSRSSDGAVQMTQDLVAQVVGVSRQHVNKLLAELQRDGIIEARYGKLRLIDLDRLNALILKHLG